MRGKKHSILRYVGFLYPCTLLGSAFFCLEYLVGKMKKTLILGSADLLAMITMGFLTHWFVFGSVGNTPAPFLVGTALVFLAALLVSGFYRFRIANSSIELVRRAMFSMVPVALLLFIVVGKKYGFSSHLTRWFLNYSGFSFVAVVGLRAVWRMYSEHGGSADSGKPLAIVYGAGDLGSAMARLAQKGRFDYRIEGFIDDNEGLRNEIVISYPVLGNLDNLDNVLRERHDQVNTLIIAITNLSADKIQKAVIIARKYGLDTKIVPNLFETKGRADVSIRELNMADLLGRSLDTVEKEPLFEMFSDKTILVTGAGGSIGSEICSQLMEYGLRRLVVLDIDETEIHDLSLRLLNYESEWSDKVVPVVCDIRNAAKVESIMEKFRPDIVFHAAAYKHVPLMELYPEEAIINNVCGSYNVFRACRECGVGKVVVISSDKAVNPTNIMGATKRVVEMMAAAMNSDSCSFCCVRFGNVIGSRGSMLPLFLDEIRVGKPVTVTDRRIIRYFMAIPEAVSLVFRAASIAGGGEVMVLDMGQPVNIYDFANKLIDAFGDGRSTVKIMGLRPGEKLYEELLADKDNTLPTENRKIFKARVNGTVFSELDLEAFVRSLDGKTPQQLVSILEKTVPEFHRAIN